jgi:hypothetical protein
MKTNCGSSPESITEVKNIGQIDCEVSLPARQNLRPSGQRKLLKFINRCFEIGWNADNVSRLKDFWLDTHDEFGNIIKAS